MKPAPGLLVVLLVEGLVTASRERLARGGTDAGPDRPGATFHIQEQDCGRECGWS